jgi:Ca2+-binding RTX toxin-like protein
MWSQEWFHRVSNLSLGLAMFAGDDVVRLHDGDDYFVDIAGRLEISLGGGNDTLFAFDGPDVMGGDIVLGEDGNDTIWYQGNFGRFYGGNGDDTIGDQGGGNIGGHRFYGGTGNDTIEAIGRNSTIYEEEGSGNDHYTGGDDVILDYRLGTAALILDLGLGSAMGGENQTGVYGIDTITGIRRVVGSQGDDQLTGYDHTGTELSGHLGNDVVTGGLFGDTLRGGEGADTLFGGGGADRLDGGAADDEMNGGLGNDIYFVDSLGDVVTGEVAFGAGGGIDTVITSVSFTAPANVELVRAQGLADGITLTGNDAPGTLVGSLGANTLNGRGGNDQLNGNQGNDTLIGGEGRDTLVGGAGADSFVFTSVSNSRTGAASRDYVNGFTRAPGEQDRIDLSAIDANTGLGGLQDFTFIGTAAFTAAGQVRVQSLGGPNACIVEVNVNAGLAADMQIFVNLQQTMAAGDFVL